ncbi:hypothetical protein NUU61_004473 [Penicillium alfredii]|uniref:Fatty acyl-CoA reductase n=1 Tax=Penicillium alfredii TaxID=1506179 RepID=A0A9W9FL72_9EURO|nr:uncharacterized protein NUU61_004473 [Penicillium alfredii]KAJ5102251.1 hypothetical protein NUU61_004473 [Penicillium alfredii]
MTTALLNDPRITIITGDIMKDNLGLSDLDWQVLQGSVNIIIHAASSINLQSSLKRLSSSIIAPSVSLAERAHEFKKLERFVFVSTAYANTHLWPLSQEPDVAVKEHIYPLCDRASFDPADPESWTYLSTQTQEEWNSVQQSGSSREYESYDFPWAYGYAKHLAERLLLQRFAQHQAIDKLLIIRPSVFAPAISHPHPGFSSPFSTPLAGLSAAINLCFGRHATLAARSQDPLTEATLDEVPVDVVVDRLLTHLACGTIGCVHAVSGRKSRQTVGEWYRMFMEERRLPWAIKPVWTSLSWHSPQLHPVERFYKIIGTSFDFHEDRTVDVLWGLSAHEALHLRLFTDGKVNSLRPRRNKTRQLGICIGKKQRLPLCLVKLLCRSGKKNCAESRVLCQDNGLNQEKSQVVW